jgi:murein DD-endopeptidase MepM/ murein hydrolase activator NlpD
MTSLILKPHVLILAFAGCLSAQAVSDVSAEAIEHPTVRLGSRAAFNALYNGDIPRRWLIRAGGDIPPKTLVWPIKGRGIGRGFGSDNGRHLAIDITAPPNTPVRVAARGLVAYANNTVKGYGKMMLVIHPGGWVTMYAHLNDYKARSGEWVTRGQIIALTGNTGISRGPHLHFALLVKGCPVDPEPLFQEIPKQHRCTKKKRRTE